MASLVLLFISLFHIIGTLSSVLPDGSQPDMCNSCCQGPAGLPGVPGSAGIPGSPGSNGLTGRDGLKGEIGMKGEVGVAGAPGVRGPTGPQGPSGEQGQHGDPGLQGLPGKLGPRGIEGRPGVDGRPGADGRPGSDGQPGADGQPGPVGPKGSKGESPQVRQSAFSVFKTSSQVGNSGDVLTFDIAETNLGSHYSLNTHKFTCQIPGTYVFMFTISGNHYSHDPLIELMKDRARITMARIYDGQSSVNNFHQSSNMAIVQMSADNQVWLEFCCGNGEQVYSGSGKYTSFSGFLLYAE